MHVAYVQSWCIEIACLAYECLWGGRNVILYLQGYNVLYVRRLHVFVPYVLNVEIFYVFFCRLSQRCKGLVRQNHFSNVQR